MGKREWTMKVTEGGLRVISSTSSLVWSPAPLTGEQGDGMGGKMT